MKKILIALTLMLCAAIGASAQQVINGSESFVSGGWIGTRVANAAGTGTTLNKLAKLTGNPSTAVITGVLDTTNVQGVVGAGAGTTGYASIVQVGQVPCVFDGATTAGDYVINSSSVAGDCSDGGSTRPAIQNFGHVMSTNGGAGTYTIVAIPDNGSTISPSATLTIASGSYALGTSDIPNNNCATLITISAPSAAATDGLILNTGGDASGATGYSGTSGLLTIYSFLTSGNVNIHVCNWTGADIPSPGAVTINYRIVR